MCVVVYFCFTSSFKEFDPTTDRCDLSAGVYKNLDFRPSLVQVSCLLPLSRIQSLSIAMVRQMVTFALSCSPHTTVVMAQSKAHRDVKFTHIY